ncbi:MAG: ABC transporter permease subunit [Chryseolinea sp.]
MRDQILFSKLVKMQYWLFVKQKTHWLLLFVFFVTGLYGLYQGFAFKGKQIATINAFRDEKVGAINEMVKGFHADTTTVAGKEAYQKVTTLILANWYTILPAYKIPNTTALFAIGQGDVFPYYYTVKLESFFMQLFKQNEITNPLRALAGHFDVSFWVVLLLPLFIIVLSFNILSSELDNGNWRLINSQGVSQKRWVTSKIVLVASVTGVLLIVVWLSGLVINYVSFSQPPTLNDFIFFTGATIYLTLWMSVLFLINALSLNTSASALYSGVLWVLICIVSPALTTAIIEKTVAVDNTVVSRMSRRPQGSKFEDDAFGIKTIRQIGVLRPQYRHATVTPKSKGFSFTVYCAYHELLDDSNKVVVRQYFDNIEKRQRLTNASGFINPAAAMDGIFAGLAHNDAEANHRFIWGMMDFHQAFHDALFPAIFFDRKLSESDFKKLPVQKQASFQHVPVWVLIHLMSFIVIILLLFRWANTKFKNRLNV